MDALSLYVLMPNNALLLDVAGPLEVLRIAALYGDHPPILPRFIGLSSQIQTSIGLPLALEPLPAAMEDNAILLICGTGSTRLGGSAEPADDGPLISWLKQVVHPSHEIISICSGALHLAKSGLLDGRRCTTHHACLAELKALAPKAIVEENRLFVRDGPVLSSAGILAGIDLMLHWVDERMGRTVALKTARHMVAAMRRAGGDPQLSPFFIGRNHLDEAIHRVQDAMSLAPEKGWHIADLAALAHMSERSFSRHFAEEAGLTPMNYLARLRISGAETRMRESADSLETIAFESGFQSARDFRRVYARINGHTPKQQKRSDAAD